MSEASVPGIAFLRPLFSGLATTAFRFPLPLAAALLFCVTMVADNHNWLADAIGDDDEGRLKALAVLGFFWTLSARLIAESRGWGAPRSLALAAAGLAFLVLKLFADQPILHFHSETVLFLGPALVLLVMAAPFLGREATSEAFWDFNRTAWLAAGLAFLAALILASGLSFALWAIEELFGWNFPHRIDSDIWIVAFGFFCPWLALSRVPRRFDAPDGAACPRALSVLIAYVLVPLAVGYVVIIYAYIARILVLWELPRGQVASIVCGYVGFGIATYLAAWPLRAIGPVHVRLFHRFFFHALVPPVVLLVVAVAERVSAYGVTEPRYMVAASAAWMAVLTVAFLRRRALGLQAVPVTLAALLLASSFGPWGAADVSLRSQTARLTSILTDAGLLMDGRIIRSSAEDAVARGERREAVSIVRYLGKTGRLNALSGWFEEGVLPPDANPNEVLAAISQSVNWTNSGISEPIQYTARSMLPVSGYDLLVGLTPNGYVGEENGEVAGPDDTIFRWSRDAFTELFWLQLGEGEKVSFDLVGLIDRMRERYGESWAEEVSDSDMTLDDRIGPYEVRLSVRHLEGSIYDGHKSLFEVDLVLLLRTADEAGAPSADPG
jgi:hypothetical protein